MITMFTKIVPPITSLCVVVLFIEPPAISAVKPSISITKIESQGSDTHAEAFETKDYREFESDKSYIVTAQGELEDGSKFHHVFYWIGSQASRRSAASAAAFAIEMQFTLNLKTDVIRETEGRESRTLETLFEVDDFKDISDGPKTSEQVAEDEPRMILITDDYLDEMKEVTFSPEYSQDLYICFVAFNTRIVFLYCGNGVTNGGTAMRMSIYLARIMAKKMGPQAKIVKMIGVKGDPEFFLEFQRVSDAVAKLRASTGYEKKEIASLHGDFVQKFIMIDCSHHDSNDPASRVIQEAASVFPKSIFPFNSQHAYSFNSCLENVGVLLWMGTEADVSVRKNCAYGTEYDHPGRPECSLNMPITLINEENVTLPRGERRLQVHLESLVKVMYQLGLSWTDVLKFDADWSV